VETPSLIKYFRKEFYMDLNITKPCGRCGGTGTDTNVEPHISCSICGGTGRLEINKLNIDALESIINDIKSDTSNIMDAVASTKSTVEEMTGKIDSLQSTCDKILEIVQKIGG
jgi:peptidoglycan hydrolase CwlO-like protein